MIYDERETDDDELAEAGIVGGQGRSARSLRDRCGISRYVAMAVIVCAFLGLFVVALFCATAFVVKSFF